MPAGFAGQFFSNTEQLGSYIAPLRIFAGIVVIYMAIQTLGVFRMPFVLRLGLPMGRHGVNEQRCTGYAAAAIASMSISVGCRTCVGGTILASMLLCAGASNSPLVGGLRLGLFAVGMSSPFLIAAIAFDRALPPLRLGAIAAEAFHLCGRRGCSRGGRLDPQRGRLDIRATRNLVLRG